MSRTFLAGLALALVACSSSTEPLPLQIPDAVPFADRQLLTAIWAGLDHCTGQTMDMSKVSFYTVPDEWITVNGVEYWGYWFRDGNRVFLTDRVKTSAVALEHEMMHARIQDGTHPSAYFDGPCGDILTPVAGQG